jgi:hypothetical protein
VVRPGYFGSRDAAVGQKKDNTMPTAVIRRPLGGRARCAAVGLLVLLCPLLVQAQPATERAALEQAIRDYVRANSAVKDAIRVSNVSYEGAFAQATIAAPQIDDATVFMKKVGQKWTGIFLGTGMGPGDCASMGFPANSKMCPR